jgi:hypothetical protein
MGVGIQLCAGAPGTLEAEQQPSFRLADDDQRGRAATLGRSSRITARRWSQSAATADVLYASRLFLPVRWAKVDPEPEADCN